MALVVGAARSAVPTTSILQRAIGLVVHEVQETWQCMLFDCEAAKKQNSVPLIRALLYDSTVTL